MVYYFYFHSYFIFILLYSIRLYPNYTLGPSSLLKASEIIYAAIFISFVQYLFIRGHSYLLSGHRLSIILNSQFQSIGTNWDL